MKPVTAFDNFPPFANSGSKNAPGDAKYAIGFVPADTLPAEWANYLFHGASKGVTDLNSAVRSIWLEMNSVLAAKNITPDASANDQLLEALNKIKAEAILESHPVHSLYWTSSPEHPSITFGGGTWVQIKDKFILAAGDTYTNGDTGGSATVTLTMDNIPSHYHTLNNGNTSSSGTTTMAGFRGVSATTVSISNSSTGDPGKTFKWYADDFSGTTGTSGVSVVTGDYHSQKQGASGSAAYWQLASHTHSMGHTHTLVAAGYLYGKTDYAGKSSPDAISTLPPYISRYCWERTA